MTLDRSRTSSDPLSRPSGQRLRYWPEASSDAVRQRMQRQARRDTGPEMALRSELHRLGLRYRVNARPLPGFRRRADIIFTRARVAVFVDGCFWHGCPEHASTPKANSEWWRDKIAANVARDRDTDSRLQDAGWSVVRVWEHEDPLTSALGILETVGKRLYDLGMPTAGSPGCPGRRGSPRKRGPARS